MTDAHADAPTPLKHIYTHAPSLNQSYWLIERGQAVNHKPTLWWCGKDRRAIGNEDEMLNWTEDANKARRFLFQNNAEALAVSLFGQDGVFSITEHIWIEDSKPVTPDPTDAPPTFITREVAPQRVPADAPTRTGREPRTHELKTWPEYFNAIVSGRKRFEIRQNDRDYQVGDCLVLQEFDQMTQAYSGRSFSALVTYLLNGVFLPSGYVAMSIEPVEQAASPSSVVPTGKGEQHCQQCGRMSYVGDPIDVQHHADCRDNPEPNAEAGEAIEVYEDELERLHRIIAEQAAALQGLREQREPQPISTAPENEYIFILLPDYGWVRASGSRDHSFAPVRWWGRIDGESEVLYNPTHWIRMPEVRKESK